MKKWHRWFAWEPILMDGKWIWLEYVERRAVHICGMWGSITWEYR